MVDDPTALRIILSCKLWTRRCDAESNSNLWGRNPLNLLGTSEQFSHPTSRLVHAECHKCLWLSLCWFQLASKGRQENLLLKLYDFVVDFSLLHRELNGQEGGMGVYKDGVNRTGHQLFRNLLTVAL